METTANLIEKIAAYKSATQKLIDKVEEYQEYIKRNVPYELWRHFGLGKFSSRQMEDWLVKIDGKYVPSTVSGFNRGKYWYGDYNYWYNAVTSKELVEWSKHLPNLMQEAILHVEKLTQNAINADNAINLN